MQPLKLEKDALIPSTSKSEGRGVSTVGVVKGVQNALDRGEKTGIVFHE